jgi:hypothetical protein
MTKIPEDPKGATDEGEPRAEADVLSEETLDQVSAGSIIVGSTPHPPGGRPGGSHVTVPTGGGDPAGDAVNALDQISQSANQVKATIVGNLKI